MKRVLYLFFLICLLAPSWVRGEEAKVSPRPFLTGYQAFQAGRFEEALKSFSTVDSADFLYDYVLYYRGASLLELRRFFEARESFYQLSKLYPKSVWVLESLKGEAESLLHLRRWIEYRRTLDRYSEESKDRRKEVWAALKVAESYALEGEWHWALKALKDLWLQYPETEESEEALRLADLWQEESGGEISFTDPDDQLQRARVLTEQGQHELALQIYLSLPDIDPPVLAEAYFQARYYQDAVRHYMQLYQSATSSADPPQILSRLATSYTRVENNEKAIEFNHEMLRRYPDTNWALHARHKLLFLYQDSGAFNKAVDLAKVSLQNLNGGPEDLYLRKKLVWNLYRAGNLEAALTELLTQDPQSLYWKSRILRQLERADPALEQKILQNHPWDYYSLFFLGEHAENQKDFRQKISAWEKERSHLPYVSVSVSSLCDTSYFHLCRAVVLSDLGLADEVRQELRWVRREQDIRDEALLSFLARLALQYEDYRTVYWASWFLNRDERSTIESWEWHYPRAYRALVEKWGRHYGVDPMLLYALMRQESRFDSKIISPVGALGLMQIIPATGIRLSRQLGLQEFDVTTLTTPEMSIRLSAYYLKLLSERYNGQKPLMLAAYNAGEEAVDRWLKSRRELKMWEFLEEIPYQETYDYVQRVMRNYWIYHYLYSS